MELNNKMQQFTENAMKFTMDGGMVYDFKVGGRGGCSLGVCGMSHVNCALRRRLPPAGLVHHASLLRRHLLS